MLSGFRVATKFNFDASTTTPLPTRFEVPVQMRCSGVSEGTWWWRQKSCPSY